jgi:hypothetical protein
MLTVDRSLLLPLLAPHLPQRIPDAFPLSHEVSLGDVLRPNMGARVYRCHLHDGVRSVRCIGDGQRSSDWYSG